MTETMQDQVSENPAPLNTTPAKEVSGSGPPRPDRDAPTGDEIAFVQRLSQLDRGDLAALRRSAGDTIAEGLRKVPWFYGPRMGVDRGRHEEIYFLVATLYGLNKLGDTGDFGHSMWRLAQAGGNSDAIERRFWVLLDAQFGETTDGGPTGGELSYRLRQLVKLAKSKEVGVHWAQLLHDLKRWGFEDKSVQKKWARNFYPAPNAGPSAGEDKNLGAPPAP
ncbi:MAG TPA: type I-E CRISPR-associated protein Cse2/CasB [Armatimonadota bacterium]|nr:type I-E CRISPR-associated protein Cse2/CasB [Armatimonadota bacterium]